MPDTAIAQLKQVVESQRGGTATFMQTVPVRETHGEQTVWDGVGSVFELDHHPRAKLAYAWSYELSDAKRRFSAVLHVPPFTWPARAVQAAIVAEACRL